MFSYRGRFFALPEIELSPVRHLIVTRNAGGFILGAYAGNQLIGFVLSVPAVLYNQRAFYSHMTAIKTGFQSGGIGTKLKWAQRERSLAEGVKYIKWTFQPVLARNAFFNLEKLGAVINQYAPNFYGTDYPSPDKHLGLDSDRLFCEWHLEVKSFAMPMVKLLLKTGGECEIAAVNNWNYLVKTTFRRRSPNRNGSKANFKGFCRGLICRSFIRDEQHPKFLLY